MTTSSIRFDRRPKRGLQAALALAAFGVSAWIWHLQANEPMRPGAAIRTAADQVARTPLPSMQAVVEPPHEAAEQHARAAAANAGASPCVYQQIALSIGKRSERACVSATRVEQNGSTRRYVLEPQGPSGWTLTIDAGGETALAARLSAPGRGDYGCEGSSACEGIAIGARDAQGGRAINLRDAKLHADGAPAGEGTATVEANLRAVGGQADESGDCAGESIAIVQSDRSATTSSLTFCTMGGGGTATLAGEGRGFTLVGAEGEVLMIGVNGAGNVDHMSFGALHCDGAACAGASSQATGRDDSEGGRTFSFSGVMLADGPAKRRTATLNGSAVLPAF